MRRVVSILLAVAFGLGPVAFAIGYDDSSSLPACCRRHGAHHCAMDAVTPSASADRQSDSFVASSHCPLFPAHQNASPSSMAALVHWPTAAPIDIQIAPVEALRGFASGTLDLYTFTLRGPPAALTIA